MKIQYYIFSILICIVNTKDIPIQCNSTQCQYNIQNDIIFVEDGGCEIKQQPMCDNYISKCLSPYWFRFENFTGIESFTINNYNYTSNNVITQVNSIKNFISKYDNGMWSICILNTIIVIINTNSTINTILTVNKNMYHDGYISTYFKKQSKNKKISASDFIFYFFIGCLIVLGIVLLVYLYTHIQQQIRNTTRRRPRY